MEKIDIGNNGWWIVENQGFTEKDRLCLPIPLSHCCGENIYPVAFVDSFLLTASGKLQKYKLQEQSLEYFPEAAAE